jgi:ketosteroid isomerase-like protein
MKRSLLVALALIVLCGMSYGQKAAAGTNDPTKGVHDTIDRLVEGIKQLDVDKVMSTYEKSDRILFFNNNGSVTIGWDNMKANRESLYAKTKNVTLELTGLRIEMLGKTAAYATCKWKQSQEFDGKLENASGRMTLVFKLIGKDWKIVHLHTSPDNPAPTRPVLPSERDNQ